MNSADGVASFGHTTGGGPRYGELVTALQRLTDAVTAADPPEPVADQTIAGINKISRVLEDNECADPVRPAGHRWDLPARGHPLLIPIGNRRIAADETLGVVRFSRSHMGHPGLVHGGFLPLMFDEAFGVFPLRVDPVARTAALEVRYYAGIPIDTDLTVSARLLRTDGRKIYVAGELRDADQLLAEADGLFIQPSVRR